MRRPTGFRRSTPEPVVSKTFFSAFSSPALDGALAAAGADTLLVAGVHLHGCVRATVLDAYQRGLAVWVAEDAVGSDDPLHAAVTRRYLEPPGGVVRSVLGAPPPARGRGPYAGARPPSRPPSSAGRALSVSATAPEVHRSPRDTRDELFAVAAAGAGEVEAAVSAARRAQPGWERLPAAERHRGAGTLRGSAGSGRGIADAQPGDRSGETGRRRTGGDCARRGTAAGRCRPGRRKFARAVRP